MNDRDRVVVVGGSVAGLTVSETLRRRGFGGPITLVGEEAHLPYDRPPLSKQVLLGTWGVDRLTFPKSALLDQMGISPRWGSAAVSLCLDDRIVWLRGGGQIPFDRLVIATGVSPRVLPGASELEHVYTLRTIDDAMALREQFVPERRLVVIGAGFLGCEVAAAARKAGLTVSVVDPLATPMERQLGAEVGRKVLDLHLGNGVDIRCGVAVRRLLGERSVTGVELATGEVLESDFVLVAIGSVPATGWLDGSGLEINDGLVCDPTCQAAPGVYAAGDVARWWHNTLGTYVRVEHRLNASCQAVAVAMNLLGDNKPYTPMPYFWTDQFDARIQGYGSFPADGAVQIIRGDLGDQRFVADYVHDGRVVGVLGWNMPKEIRVEAERIGTAVDALAQRGG